jgi:hypothetical protein
MNGGRVYASHIISVCQFHGSERSALSINALLRITSYEPDPLELAKKTEIILVKEAYVVDATLQHGDAFHAQTKSKP